MQEHKPRALIVHGGLEMCQRREGAATVANVLTTSGLDMTETENYSTRNAPEVVDVALVVPIITSSTLPREKIAPLMKALRNGT